MYYGLDIGGTKIEFAAFDQNQEKVAAERVVTPHHSYQAFLNTLVYLIEKYDAQFGVKGKVGIGIPGIENKNDYKATMVNIPVASGKPLRFDLESVLNRSVKIENDANCFTLSEAYEDNLQSYDSVLGLILGTGFGSGLVIHGKLYSGQHALAGEVGHIRLPLDAWLFLGKDAPLFSCGCGKKGCLDSYLSGRGFELLYQHYYGEVCAGIEIIEREKQGDKKAIQHIDYFLELLAICLANLCSVLDPSAIVFGGGLSNFEGLYPELKKRLPKYLLGNHDGPALYKAVYGDAGGVRGAALLNYQAAKSV